MADRFGLSPKQAEILRDAGKDPRDFQGMSRMEVNAIIGGILAKKPQERRHSKVWLRRREAAIKNKKLVPGMTVEITPHPSSRNSNPVFAVVKEITADHYVVLEGRKSLQSPERLEPVKASNP